MLFVLDTSITMAWCFADESTSYTQYILDELSRSYAEVACLWMFEVSNVLAIKRAKGKNHCSSVQRICRDHWHA